MMTDWILSPLTS